jgi:taurine dehydrogenase small subunit
MSPTPTTLIHEMFAAFNRHDAAGVVACMTDDVVFEAAAGPEVYGRRFSGKAAVQEAFANTFKDLSDVRWDEVQVVEGARWVVTTWTMRATRQDGKRLEVEGLDLFTFKNGLVCEKRAFRKERPAL